MKAIFYGGQKAGMISLLTLLALKLEVILVLAEDDDVLNLAKKLKLQCRKVPDLKDYDFGDTLEMLNADLFVCCHARQIIGARILKWYEGRIINLHPCLYKYKGADPVQRMLADGETKASVGCHLMTKEVDGGEVIVENFKEIKETSVVGIYNELYPLYAETLIDAIEKL